MARIQIIPPDEAEGRLKEVYDRVSKGRGNVAIVHQLASLHPDLMETHLDLYMAIMYGRGGLRRRERELIATAVSRTNGCDYCVTHHKEALARYEKDDALVEQVAKDPAAAPLDPRDRALVDFAVKTTRSPADVHDADVQRLRDAGLTDEDVLAASAVTAYFNFVNRMVLTLGAELETEDDRDYKY